METRRPEEPRRRRARATAAAQRLGLQPAQRPWAASRPAGWQGRSCGGRRSCVPRARTTAAARRLDVGLAGGPAQARAGARDHRSAQARSAAFSEQSSRRKQLKQEASRQPSYRFGLSTSILNTRRSNPGPAPGSHGAVCTHVCMTRARRSPKAVGVAGSPTPRSPSRRGGPHRTRCPQPVHGPRCPSATHFTRTAWSRSTAPSASASSLRSFRHRPSRRLFALAWLINPAPLQHRPSQEGSYQTYQLLLHRSPAQRENLKTNSPFAN